MQTSVVFGYVPAGVLTSQGGEWVQAGDMLLYSITTPLTEAEQAHHYLKKANVPIDPSVVIVGQGAMDFCQLYADTIPQKLSEIFPDAEVLFWSPAGLSSTPA